MKISTLFRFALSFLLIGAVSLVLVGLTSKIATAATKKASTKAPSKNQNETRMSFTGTKLNGKLQEGSLRKIVVENDKSLEDLLGVRKKFDDRESDEKERNASW